jgi:exonuclease SbcC
MKIAIIADLQPTGDRLDEFRRQLDAAIDVALEERCPILAIAGDVFEAGNIGDAHRPTGAILRAVCEPLRRFLGRSKSNEIVCVRGNHDTDNDGPDDALAALEAMDLTRVFVARRSQWWGSLIHKINIACLPWRWAGEDPDTPPDAEAELEALLADDLPPRGFPRLLLGHVQVLGAKYNSLRVCEGGTWIVSQEKLRELVTRYKIDRVAFGDFHLRDVDLAGLGMGGFMGNLWQQNFSHVGNPQGLEVWNTETGEVVWHELREARRHSIWIVDRPQDVEGVVSVITNASDFNHNRVWLKTDGFDLDRATKRSIEELGIRVSAINVKRVERVARLESADKLSLTDDRALLEGYITTRQLEISKEAIARLEDGLEEIIKDNPRLGKGDEADRVATVTPLRTRICGIGRHADTEIVWEGLPELVAVHGDNGAGKTTAVGGLYAALYNALPGYTGNLYDNLTAHGSGDALVEADFEVGGRRYRARREIIGGNSKNPEQERWLYDLDTGAIIAGPKDFDFRAAVDRIVGNSDTALATWFMTANREGDLTEIAPAERRALFGRLLGLERLDAVSDAAAEKASEARSMAKAAEVPPSKIEEAKVAVEEAVGHLEVVKVLAAQRRLAVQSQEAEHAKAAAALAELDADDSSLRAAIASHERLVVELRTLDADLEAARRDVDSLQAQAAGLTAAREAADKLDDARAVVKELQIQVAAADKHRAWALETTRLADVVDRGIEVIASLETASGVTQETRELAAQIPAIEAEYQAAAARVKQAQAALLAWETERAGIASRLQRAGEELARVEDQLSKKPETPFGSDCAPCPFMKAWMDLPARKEEIERKVELIRLELREKEASKPSTELEDLTPIIRRGESARGAQRALQAAAETEAKLKDTRDRLDKAERNLHAHTFSEPPAVIPPHQATLDEANQKAQDLAILAAGVKPAEAAAAMLETRQAALATMTQRKGSLAKALEEARGPAERAKAALTQREELRRRAQDLVNLQIDTLRQARAALDKANHDVGVATARLQESEARLQEAEQARANYLALLERQKDFELLRRAFGREGIQPLLVEVSVPDLEAVTSELLTEAFDRPSELAIRTLSETRKGDMIEDFRLEVADENGARDISRFSGGEREIFSLLLRLAVGLWIARRRGASLESVFVDEAFNKLDPSRTKRVVEILLRVSRHFRRIVLLTPKGDVAAHFPARIEVRPSLDGSAIRYIGATPAEPITMPTPDPVLETVTT